MKCPFCTKDNTRVIDTRPVDGNVTIKRRRVCDNCGKRFTTFEKVEAIPLVVVKKDQSRERYSRRKIENGIYRACHKRPVSIEEINKIVDQIEIQIFNLEQKEVKSSQIGEILMEHLRKADIVAYVRFASVYREFKDVNTFMEELKALIAEHEQ